MAVLSTTYDTSLKKKIFVLRGEEGYARTTDVLVTPITNFSDYDTHINYCHVGLEIQVLREIGNAHIIVYANDDELLIIPWSDTGMGTIIDNDWNDKGVYWVDGKLIIGKRTSNPYVNTGLYLLYDVENKIKVKYTGNKECLGSSTTVSLTVPQPDTFESTLTLTTPNTGARYGLSTDVTNLSLLLESENTLTSAKTVNIYDGDTLIKTVSATQDTALTVDLSDKNLSDGVHNLTARFEGDDEAYSSETTLDISVGYKLTNITYPSYLVQGQTGSVSCKVYDYFNNAWSGLTVKASKYASSTWTDLASTTSASDGTVSLTNVAIDSNPWAIKIGSWHTENYNTSIILVSSITATMDESFVQLGDSSYIRGTIYSNGSPLQESGVNITITKNGLDWTDTYHTTTNATGQYSYSIPSDGKISVCASVDNTSVSSCTTFTGLDAWWSVKDNKTISSPVSYRVTQTKQSNGWLFTPEGLSTGGFWFSHPLPSGDFEYTYEFKLFNINSSNDEIMGVKASTLGLLGYYSQGLNFKIVQDNNAYFEMYVDGTLKASGTFSPSDAYNNVCRFSLATDGGIKFEDLKIYRSE